MDWVLFWTFGLKDGESRMSRRHLRVRAVRPSGNASTFTLLLAPYYNYTSLKKTKTPGLPAPEPSLFVTIH